MIPAISREEKRPLFNIIQVFHYLSLLIFKNRLILSSWKMKFLFPKGFVFGTSTAAAQTRDPRGSNWERTLLKFEDGYHIDNNLGALVDGISIQTVSPHAASDVDFVIGQGKTPGAVMKR